MAFRRDEGRARALALDDSVGGKGGAVDDDSNILRRQASRGQDRRHTFLDALLGRRRVRQNFGGAETPFMLQGHIGESAAYVDGQTGALHQLPALLGFFTSARLQPLGLARAASCPADRRAEYPPSRQA